MGLPFMQSLEMIKVIHGRPQIRGPQAVALIRARVPSAHLECVESSSEVATWHMARDGSAAPKAFTATIQEARDAGLLQSQVWKRYPAKMLKWWAASAGTAELFGDVLCGVSVASDDAQAVDVGEIAATPAPTPEVLEAEIVDTDAIAQTVASGGVGEVDGTKIRARSLKREEGIRCVIEAMERDENGRTTWEAVWYSAVLQPEDAQGAVFNATRIIAAQGIETARAAGAWDGMEASA